MAILCSGIVLLAVGCSSMNSASVSNGDNNFRKAVEKLPAYSCYEETTESFQQRVKQSALFKDSTSNMEYLFLPGDGTYRERLFVYNPATCELKLIQGGEIYGGGMKNYDHVYRYDPKSDSLKLIYADGKPQH